MTDRTHYAEAVENLEAADNALTTESETFRLRKAQVLATLAQSAPKSEDANGPALVSRVLDAVGGSIGKADSKAAFVTSLDTAVLAGVLAMQPTGLGIVGRVLLGIGTAFVAVAALFAVAVVLPVLRPRHCKTAGNSLYFGTVRHHSPEGLRVRLASEPEADVLCAQAVILSRLSWVKHRLLQVAMLATITGGLLIAGTLLIAGGAR